jgi:hypothetical protein
MKKEIALDVRKNNNKQAVIHINKSVTLTQKSSHTLGTSTGRLTMALVLNMDRFSF